MIENRLILRVPQSAPLLSALGLTLILVSACHGHESATNTSDTSATAASSTVSQSATTDTSGTYGGARSPTPLPIGATPGAIGTSGGNPAPPRPPAVSTTGSAEPTTTAPAGTPAINSKSVVRKN